MGLKKIIANFVSSASEKLNQSRSLMLQISRIISRHRKLHNVFISMCEYAAVLIIYFSFVINRVCFRDRALKRWNRYIFSRGSESIQRGIWQPHSYASVPAFVHCGFSYCVFVSPTSVGPRTSFFNSANTCVLGRQWSGPGY